jgi:hypothetical protein
MSEEHYSRDFPDLTRLGYQRTSEPAYYKCISYVVDDLKRRWWPGEYHPRWSDDYWPASAPNEETLTAFCIALATERYVPCDDGSLEPEFEKIAIYALQSQEITHAAKQQPDGTWRSKLGPDEDIEHTLDGLVGPCYGRVVAFLKRPLKQPVEEVANPALAEPETSP